MTERDKVGIRFRCHHCEHELNLKEFQAGRRGRCPACSHRFRVPMESTEFSIPLEDDEQSALMASGSSASAGRRVSSASTPTFNLQRSSHDPDLQVEGVSGSKGRAQERTGADRTTANQSQGSDAQAASVPSQSGKTRMPQAVAEAPHSVWYVRPATGGQFGPADPQVFYDWLVDHRVAADALVWRDGWSQWQVAGQALEDFFGSSWRLGQSSTAATPADSLAPSAEQEPVYEQQPVHEAMQEMAPDTLPSPSHPGTSSVSNVAALRRKKQQKIYGMVIAGLVLMALVLVGVLVSVVMKQ